MVPLFKKHERFLKFIRFNKDNNCWEWKGCLSKGYGYFVLRENGKSLTIGAHRVSYSLFKDTNISGLVIDHICRNRACVNPEHLRAVSATENVLENSNGEGAKNSIKTECPRGHAYNKENTLFYRGKRYCKCCKSKKFATSFNLD